MSKGEICGPRRVYNENLTPVVKSIEKVATD